MKECRAACPVSPEPLPQKPASGRRVRTRCWKRGSRRRSIPRSTRTSVFRRPRTDTKARARFQCSRPALASNRRRRLRRKRRALSLMEPPMEPRGLWLRGTLEVKILNTSSVEIITPNLFTILTRVFENINFLRLKTF